MFIYSIYSKHFAKHYICSIRYIVVNKTNVFQTRTLQNLKKLGRWQALNKNVNITDFNTS